ncbi:MAG: alpha-ketoacid dehydrogenase subunit beta [Actinobacteria bacterium]|nr:MAG: alpha-ketoacid dehydrogenase subunit beta [Actinomycetota bacterium]
MAVLNMAQAINQALDQALAADPRVIVLGEDVGRTGGVFRVTDGLQQRHGENRVVDTPVSESGIVGAALGLAVGGMRPVAEMQFMGFSYPAFDQVISHVARFRHRSRHRFTAPLVIRIPYGGGIGAAEHHSESTEAIYVHTPGLKVVVPGTPRDAKGLLLAAIDDPDPVVFLEPIRRYRSLKGEVPEDRYTVRIGEAWIAREGRDVTLVAWGAMLRETNQAADLLAAEGVEAEVLDLRSLVPMDVPALIRSVQKTGRAVVVHEAPRTGGLAGELIALIQERALYSLQAPVARVTGWDTVFPLKRSEHLYLPTVDRIAAAARTIVET